MKDDPTLNFALIGALSLFGLGMALATVWWIPSTIEPAFWLLIFIACALIIARTCRTRHFLHGFLVSLANCVWVTSAHVLFYQSYLANHASEAAMLKTMPLPDSPRAMMTLMGPVVGVVSGLVLGGFSFVAGKVFKRS
jgi:hypothetical protein